MSSLGDQVHVNGYRRDPRGIWRYEVNGQAVPSARDLTIRRLWRFPMVGERRAEGESGRRVAVPVELLPGAPELGFCRAFLADRCRVEWGGARVDAVLVPGDVWGGEADRSLGIDAPELAPHRLLDVGRIAALIGTRPTTVRSYVQRGYLPKPTVEGLSFPLWALPPLLFGLRARAGQGTAQPGRTEHRSSRSAHRVKGESSAELLARLDAELERLAPTVTGRPYTWDDEADEDPIVDLTTVDDERPQYSDRYSDSY